MEFSIQEDGMNGMEFALEHEFNFEAKNSEWKYRGICEEAINGKYSIQCKRKD